MASSCATPAGPAVESSGTLRACSPKETLRRAEAVAGKVGITRVANMTGLDCLGIPTWTAVRPLARTLSVSQGKGITHELARASAMMESIELYHAEMHVPRGKMITPRQAAGSRECLHVAGLPLKRIARQWWDDPMEWIECRSVFDGRTCWLPRRLVHLDRTEDEAVDCPFVSSTNGLASGNTREEAILHGLLEVVERDQISFWHEGERMKQGGASRVLLQSLKDPICERLVARIVERGLRLYLWYVSTNVNLPTFLCTIVDATDATLFPLIATGSGCHVYKHIALSRAITEAAQSRLTHISAARDDCGWERYQSLRASAPTVKQWIAERETEAAMMDYQAVPSHPPGRGVEDCLEFVKTTMAAGGLEDAFVVDLTQADLGIPVCFAVVPGAEFSANSPTYLPGQRLLAYRQEIGAK